ncbi:MAG TPA: penicillin-binding protein, partial [Firmicutes bacterium]|nr:penicillin-binding protein [Bacillota bacterium]
MKFLKSFFQSLWTVIKGFLLVFLLGGIAAMMIGGFILVKTIETAPELDVSKIYATESTYIYDQDGNLITILGVEQREWVSYSDISPVLIDAIIATEDSKFFEHHGVDWQRFLVALVTNLASGEFDQGASTLTQQLIKQSHLTSEKSIDRKIKEIYLSMQLEKVLTKEQIIEAYLNYSPFGGSVYGIQRAAEYYFGKEASDLTLSEAATLAGIVQSPNRHRPDTYPESAETRRNTVLKLMVKHGYINDNMATLAAAQPITDMLVYETSGVDDKTQYQSYIDVVLNEVRDKYGLDPYSGLQIYTYMDPEAQAHVYNIQNSGELVNIPQDMQSGIVFMETSTGYVKAIGGGSNQVGERQFNYATQIKRQPGSTAKPIFAYGPAMEYKGWGTGTTITDELYTYQTSSNTVIRNWDRIYRGNVTVRDALNNSLNVPAVKAFNAAGIDNVKEFASNLGMPDADEIYESAAIGGVSEGYSPLIMAGAYAAFGNEGVYNEPITVAEIVQPDGTTIYADQRSEKVMSEETAYLMTDALHSVMTTGTGTRANVAGMYLSGKTGTTNFPEEMNMPSGAIRDSWFIGYSSHYTAAIWTGYDDSAVDSSGNRKYITSSGQATSWSMFHQVMKKLNPLDSTKPTQPSTIVSSSIEKESYPVKLPSSLTPSAYVTTELFVRGTQPTEVSTRFQKLSTPQNVKGTYDGKTLSMSWDHIDNYTLSKDDISSKLSVHSANQNKNSLSSYAKVEPAEHLLRMMLNQINTIGSTIYNVYATDLSGNTVDLGSTTSNSFNLTISVADMSFLTEFYVNVTYEKHSALASDNSTAVTINCDSCYTPVTMPNMSGWTKDKVTSWATENSIIVKFETLIDPSTTAGTVISTNPSEGSILKPNDQLTVVIAEEQVVIPPTEDNEDTDSGNNNNNNN